ncbi:MAG: hypothetical protein QG591_2007 [Planctomycetota bacterium]|nr:hypothetical protein [Planctomycetota bacterium]
MPDATAPPFWAAPALLAAVVSALGFVGKTIADLVLRLRADARDRRSRLTELYALLRAGDVAFAVQRELRKRLASQLRERLPKTANLPPGFDRLFFATYAEMTDEERQLHLLIRTMTVHTFRPLNQSLLEWLRADRYFRAVSPSDRRLGGLALFLSQLEAHLVLWVAKYEAWIPQHPEHALVFLADEERHGVGFPKGGTSILAGLLGHPYPQQTNTQMEPTRAGS